MTALPLFLGSLLFLAAAGAHAQCTARSGAGLAALVELYTSEGCSSCPPADRWLSNLRTDGRNVLVPLALHVDYWDYIGWRDAFAQPQFGERQRDSVRRAGGRVVYTPQVLLNGREFTGWRSPAAVDSAVAAVNARPARAHLALTAWRRDGGGWSAQLTGEVLDRGASAEVYLLLFENSLLSDVKAGENKGVRLRHDFVVRRWQGPTAIGPDGRIELRQDYSAEGDIDFRRSGIVAFVQDRRTGDVLQALSLPLCM